MKDPFAPKPTVRLKPLQVAGFDQPVDLPPEGLTIGRAEDNDVVLPAEGFPSVSNHHLRVDRVEGELWVEDLGAKNGTLVNGERVQRRQIAVGDVIQLGTIGPRFVIVSAAPLSETMFVDPRQLAVSESGVEELVRRRARRQSIGLIVLGIVAVSAVVWWSLDQTRRSRDEVKQAQGEAAQARSATDEWVKKLREQSAESEAHFRELETERATYIATLEQEMTRREEEANQLRERLAELEDSGASAAEIARLEASLTTTRADLDAAQAEFAKFDPINLEAARLSGVSRVRETVVLIEARMSLLKDGEVLFMDRAIGPNWEGKGEPWTLDSTGTGFVLSEDGYILTNAHVIDPPADHPLVVSALERGMEPRMRLRAVFNGGSERHELEVVKRARDVDLALAKITPFEGMPHISEFSTRVSPPPEGSDVYLLGFPLGNFAPQEGRRVIASTFRGILSRVVDGNLQVDAGVHPGNSGGPITDPSGRVIGVVFSVQATPDQTAVYTIGYGIPIQRAEQLWPPPEDGDETVDPGDE